MAKFFDNLRRATTFLLATFLWLHTFFFLNVQSALLSKISRFLRLTSSEAILVTLLVLFSFLAASGFWKTILSLLYIYGFPFVLLGYAFRWLFLLGRALNRWFKRQCIPEPVSLPLIEREASAIAQVAPTGSDSPTTPKAESVRVVPFLLRPFRRFMFLWCILLLVTTHTAIVWLCLLVILAQLGRQLFSLLKLMFFSPVLNEKLRQIGPALFTPVKNHIEALGRVTPDSDPTNELRLLWQQLGFWRKILDFLTDPYLFTRWAWVLGSALFVLVYIYIALLFSFTYFGIARISSLPYAWPDAFVTSLFIPFFVSDLPSVLPVRLLGGIHCFLVVAVGVGTVVTFLRRRLDDIRRAASELNSRFADQNFREKYLILEGKFSSTSTIATSTGNTNT